MNSARVALTLLGADQASSASSKKVDAQSAAQEATSSRLSASVEIDPRTVKLAEAMQQVSLPSEASVPSNEELTAIGKDASRRVVEDNERVLVHMQMNFENAKEAVRLHEETGKIYTTNMHGKLEAFEPAGGWDPDVFKSVVDAQKAAVSRVAAVLPDFAAGVVKMRADWNAANA